MDISNEIYTIIEPYLNYSPSNLYHYTNNDEIIFSSGYLKLSSHKELIKKQNSELSEGLHIILSILCSYPELRKHMARFLDYQKRGVMIYTLSCCLEDKSKHHSKYGNSHIKLPGSFLTNKKEYYRKHGIPLLIGKVIYEKECQVKLIENIFAGYERCIKDRPENLLLLMGCLTLILPLFKPIQDKDDKEYRIISYEIISPQGWKYFPAGVQKVFFESHEISR